MKRKVRARRDNVKLPIVGILASKNSDVPRAARSSADFRAAEIGPIDGRAAACAERTGERRKEKGIEAHIDGASTLSHPISSRISPTIPGRGAAAPPSREAA